MSVECMHMPHIYVTLEVQIKEFLAHKYTLCLPGTSRKVYKGRRSRVLPSSHVLLVMAVTVVFCLSSKKSFPPVLPLPPPPQAFISSFLFFWWEILRMQVQYLTCTIVFWFVFGVFLIEYWQSKLAGFPWCRNRHFWNVCIHFCTLL